MKRRKKSSAQLQESIAAIRNVRNVHKVDLKTAVDVSISAPVELAADIQANRGLVELLATCKLKAIRPDLPPVAAAARATVIGCDLFIEGLVDPSAEKNAAASGARNWKRSSRRYKAASATPATLPKLRHI